MDAPLPKSSRNSERVARHLFSSQEEMQLFLQALDKGGAAQTAIAWLRNEVDGKPFTCAERPPWLPVWIDVAAEGERPGKGESHERGDIYCLDLSSTFACAALSEVTLKAPTVIDVCAAPGGKGILAYRYLSPSFTVANEVIRKRTAQLISNYKRCRIDPAVVVSYDPKDLAQKCGSVAHVVIVDAPCSGQSLVMKDRAAPGAFHPATISMNERRQRRILAQSQTLVAPGGYLLYSTCTFSREENEDIVEWFMESFPAFECVPVAVLEPYRSHLTSVPCYRLWPHQGFGAGSFAVLLKRKGEAQGSAANDLLAQLWTLWRSPSFAESSREPVNRNDPEQRRPTKFRKGKGRSKEGRWRFQPGSTK